jgi:hypothetical protein
VSEVGVTVSAAKHGGEIHVYQYINLFDIYVVCQRCVLRSQSEVCVTVSAAKHGEDIHVTNSGCFDSLDELR